MKKNEAKKLIELQQRIFEIATEHGWHDRQLSAEHYLGLIMTEIAEAVEADRNNKRAQYYMFKREAYTKQPEGKENEHWKFCFDMFIKGSIEEEFADVVIRILDMVQGLHGDRMKWSCSSFLCKFDEQMSFIESAWYFIHEVLGSSWHEINDSVLFMYDWAKHLGIDLSLYIELKMKYNELRPYKHGGKKY